MKKTVLDWLDRAGSTEEPRAKTQGVRLLDARERELFKPWVEWVRESREVAAGLINLGVHPQQRVALLYPTGADFLRAFFGSLIAGAIPAPLYPPVRLGRLDEYTHRTTGLLRASEAQLVLCDRRVRRILGPVLEGARPRLGARTLEELSPGPKVSPEVRDSDLALVQFSSGTTHEPKPVALSHRAIVAQVEALSGHWPDDEATMHSGVSWLPLYHDMGLIGCLLSALERLGTLTLIPPEVFIGRPAIWLRAISKYRATISPAPNFAYALTAERVRDDELEGVDLSSWRVALNGAESVGANVLRGFNERFSHYGLRPEALTPVYGLSEACLAVTFSSLSEPFLSRRFDSRRLAEDGEAMLDPEGREMVSVGSPLPGFSIEIRSGDGPLMTEGKVGAVWVRGPSLMEGYLDRPLDTERVLCNGWLNTGDTGFLFHGDLFLTGRRKDVLIVRGRNYAPEEVEIPLGSLPGARTGCVVARSVVTQGESTEALWLFVERTKAVKERVDDEVLVAACESESLRALGVAPKEVVLLDPGVLPRTSSGKLRRAETWDRYTRGLLSRSSAPGTLGLASRVIRSEWVRRRYERSLLDDS